MGRKTLASWAFTCAAILLVLAIYLITSPQAERVIVVDPAQDRAIEALEKKAAIANSRIEGLTPNAMDDGFRRTVD